MKKPFDEDSMLIINSGEITAFCLKDENDEFTFDYSGTVYETNKEECLTIIAKELIVKDGQIMRSITNSISCVLDSIDELDKENIDEFRELSINQIYDYKESIKLAALSILVKRYRINK